MAVYTVENTLDAGKPVLVFDANGLEWTHCIEVDTETGRIERYRTGENRRIIVEDHAALTEVVHAAAPLLVKEKAKSAHG